VSPAFNWRSFAIWAYDVAMAALAWVIVLTLRHMLSGPSQPYLGLVLPMLAWMLPVQACIFWAAGLYRGLWRYASLPDMRRIALAATAATLVVPLVHVMARLDVPLPRSALLALPFVMVFLMAGSRFAYRTLREHQRSRDTAGEGQPVIILGAGDTGAQLIRELSRNARWNPVALLDDDPSKRGRVVNGVTVRGRTDEYARIARELDVSTAIIAMPTASASVRRAIMQQCVSAGAQVLTIPAVEEILAGRLGVDWLRRIELEDLLGREPIVLDTDRLRQQLSRRTVLVTGAGGSIGSELCRQIARFKPDLLVLFDVSEFALYTLREEFVESFPEVAIASRVGDVKNARRVDAVIEAFKPDVVFHAAAYKHVPMMEDGNAWEAVQNNTLGTWVVADAAVRHGVEEFVLISTDKAVNPTNVMGATKRMAELVCQALHARGVTRFETVRFGNVLGSNGSVIPKFAEQIARGGPITVTHPDIIRYFMSIPEAAQLVLQASAMGKGGEIFVLDMGDPVRIVDLARDMIRLAGHTENDIRIEFTGLRPGEKLYEELLADGENTLPTQHEKVKVARATGALPEGLDDLLGWLSQPRTVPDDEVRRDLRRWVPEYTNPAGPELRRVVG
jgi:FlaA1/EpsC-like NDP-sugar epimerase